jgi:hypothetical protein
MDTKAVKKSLSKMSSNELYNLLNQVKKVGGSDDVTNLTPQERIRKKREELKIQRMPKFMQEEHHRKQTEQSKKESQKPPSAAPNRNSKEHKAKIRKLSKKYGTITDEKYYESMKSCDDKDLHQDQINYHMNIIDVYNYQQQQTEELELEL